MSFYVKCDFCIECQRLEVIKNSWCGVCQRTGEVKRWFDLGRCIGRARRNPSTVNRLVSEFVRNSSKNGAIMTSLSSPEINARIPIFDDGFVGYHVVEEKKSSRTSKSTNHKPRSGGR